MRSHVLTSSAALMLVVGFGWWLWSYQQSSQTVTDEQPAPAEHAPDLVTLPAAKLEAAGIEVAPVEYRSIQPLRTVPGRVQYDDARHVEVKVPAPGTLTDVRVKPGDRVEHQQVLAVVSSPEVGHARADVLKNEAEHELAAARLAWRQKICDGLRQLAAGIESGRDLPQISTELKDQALGDYREQIVSAYSRHRLAASLAASIVAASETGAISGRTVKERQSERDAAEAALKSVLEQSAFETRQQCAAAQLAAEDAKRRLRISREHLHTLLGYEDAPAAADDRPLSLVEVRAPFAGTIESRTFGVSERVAQGDSLFVLADTARLWVAADIREREWDALKLAQGAELEVHAPALPDRPLTAKVHYVGREVSPRSGAVPLMAAMANPDGLLRPGQFVQVRLPLGELKEVLAVPEAAVVEHEGQPFVFRREGDQAFRRVDIRRGLTSGDWTEVVAGLAAGDPVVVRGAFYLKSELLLEGEE